MPYIDTSILAAYYCPEPLSILAEKYIIQLEKPAISHLTEVELTSALSKKVRTGGLSREDGNRILNTFLSHLHDGLFRRLIIEDIHFQMAGNWIAQFNTSLRTLDALHLALTASINTTIYTADAQLAAAAKLFGVSVEYLSANTA